MKTPQPTSMLSGFLPGWLIFLGGLTAIAPLSIDMYLPSFPTIARDLGAGSNMVELTVATFLVGLALGQMFYGPFSDRYGRKPPLYLGLSIYTLASLACIFVHDIRLLILLRFVQGLGGCSGMVIARAAIRDRMGAEGSARAFSLLMLVMGLAPILAPLLGGLVLKLMSWRAIFGILTGFGCLLLIALHFTMQETLDRHQATPVHLGNVLRQYEKLLGNRQFVAHALCGGLMQAGMFAYIAGSPFVLIELHGIKPENYGWVFGSNALGLIVASQINARLVGHLSLHKILSRMLWLPALLSLTILALVLFGVDPLFVLLIGFFGYVASLGVITPNAAAIALSEQGKQAGTASALLGTLQFSLGTMAGASMGVWHDGSALPLISVMAVCGIGSLLLYHLVAKREAK